MIRLFRFLVLCGCCACFGGLADSAAAGGPTYLILQPPVTGHHGHAGRFSGQSIPVTTQAYAYGYFGATPKRHCSRHFGYYRNYTQWSSK